MRAISDERVAEANARAAEANQRAAEAELSLAQFREPRKTLIDKHADAIIGFLAPFPGTEFDVALEDETSEQLEFWRTLRGTLIVAGWHCVGWSRAERKLTSQGLTIGEESIIDDHDNASPWAGVVAASNVEVHVHPEARPQLAPAATALVTALNEIGIEAADMGFSAPNANPAAIHILIGAKR